MLLAWNIVITDVEMLKSDVKENCTRVVFNFTVLDDITLPSRALGMQENLFYNFCHRTVKVIIANKMLFVSLIIIPIWKCTKFTTPLMQKLLLCHWINGMQIIELFGIFQANLKDITWNWINLEQILKSSFRLELHII